MSRTVVWVVGEPGAGKTTLVRSLLDVNSQFQEKPKWTIGPSVVAAGHYTGAPFDGADTVPYNGVGSALAFWAAMLNTRPLTFLDGDRFSSKTAVEFFRRLQGVRLCCLHLTLPEGEGERRRAERGSNQNAAWVKGRVTKSANFAATFADRLVLDASAYPQAQLVEKARAFIIGSP